MCSTSLIELNEQVLSDERKQCFILLFKFNALLSYRLNCFHEIIRRESFSSLDVGRRKESEKRAIITDFSLVNNF